MKKIAKVNVQKAIEKRKEFLKVAMISDNMKLHFSFGNSKLGKIPSFSVLPFLTCTNCKECGKYCYAAKNCFNFNRNIQNLAENTANVRKLPMNELIEQFDEILGGNIIYKYFRFNVAGDIAGAIGTKYFDLILNITEKYPFTTFLLFTKNYEMINTYISNGGKLPKNLSVVFSQWNNIKIDNPHNLPIAIVKVNENTEIPENAFHCSGDCSECLDCWKAEKGSTRYFDLH